MLNSFLFAQLAGYIDRLSFFHPVISGLLTLLAVPLVLVAALLALTSLFALPFGLALGWL